MNRRDLIKIVSAGIVLPNISWASLSNMKNKKILIAYFSRTKNTFIAADFIQKNIGGELFEIETAEKYPENYQEMVNIGQIQTENKIKPKLKNNGNIAAYDVIFIGSPIWNSRLAPPVASFVAANNFHGKKIYPFFTNAGFGTGYAPEYIKELLGFNYEEDISIKTDSENDKPNMLKINQERIKNNQATVAIKNADELKKWIESIK